MKTTKIILTFFLLAQTVITPESGPTVREQPKILFQEPFEDTEFASRGWYDALRGTITHDEHIDNGGSACFECRFLPGKTGCAGGTPGRHLFQETESVYISYYVKYSADYTGSNRPYHPHEFYLLTNENSMYVGPAYTHLTAYIEQIEGEPVLAIQDGENIDNTKIGQDLTNMTEKRAVAGCNGDSDGHGEGDCYLSGQRYRNVKQWRAGGVYFRDNAGKYDKNKWHFIEAFFQLNSIVGGKGRADGIVRYRYDGELLIDFDDVMFRTGEHPNMKFNQLLLAPYIGDGSPIEQMMWIDDLTVATSRVLTGIRDRRSDALFETKYLLQNYPNPFNSETVIKFTLPGAGYVDLAIHDIKGHLVDRLFTGYLEAGQHVVHWGARGQNGTGIAGGVYWCRLFYGNVVKTKKMIYIK